MRLSLEKFLFQLCFETKNGSQRGCLELPRAKVKGRRGSPQVVDENVGVGDRVLAVLHESQQVGGLSIVDGLDGVYLRYNLVGNRRLGLCFLN